MISAKPFYVLRPLRPILRFSCESFYNIVTFLKGKYHACTKRFYINRASGRDRHHCAIDGDTDPCIGKGKGTSKGDSLQE